MYIFMSPVLSSHHVTYTLLPDAATSCISERPFVELLMFIFSPNVFPPSLDALNNISRLPVLLLSQATYTLSPDVAIGTNELSFFLAASVCCTMSCCNVG